MQPRPPSSRAKPSTGSRGSRYSAAGEPRFLGDSTYTQTVDNATRTVRVDWDRDMKYPAVERIKFSEITAPTYGVAIDEKGEQKPMSGIRLSRSSASVTAARRGCWCGRWKCRASRDAGSEARRPLAAGGVDPERRQHVRRPVRSRDELPAAIRTRDADAVYGDSNYDMIPSDWKDVAGGGKRAHTLSFRLNGTEVQRLTLKEVQTNSRSRPTPSRPAIVQGGGGATAATDAPYQWVLRRMFLGRLLDSDKVYYPGERRLQAGRTGAERAARPGRHCQQPDRRHEGRAGDLRRTARRRPVARVIDAAKAKYPASRSSNWS